MRNKSNVSCVFHLVLSNKGQLAKKLEFEQWQKCESQDQKQRKDTFARRFPDISVLSPVIPTLVVVVVVVVAFPS